MHFICSWSQENETQSVYIQTMTTNYLAKHKCAQGQSNRYTDNIYVAKIFCCLNFASQMELTMVDGVVSRINPFLCLSCIPVHKHKSSLPKSSCYHQWKHSIEVSQNSRFIQVLIKVFWMDTYKFKVNVMTDQLQLCCVVFN